MCIYILIYVNLKDDIRICPTRRKYRYSHIYSYIPLYKKLQNDMGKAGVLYSLLIEEGRAMCSWLFTYYLPRTKCFPPAWVEPCVSK